MLVLLNPFLARGPAIEALTGTFTLVGQDMRFLSNLYADAGSFVLAGQDAAFSRALRLDATAGAILLDGQVAALIYNKPFPADAGGFVLTGNEAQVLRSLLFSAGTGAITVAGEDASFLRSLLFTAEVGSFVLGGQDAAFSPGVMMAAGAGAFTLDGQAAGLERSIPLAAGVGVFTVSGQAAGLKAAHRLSAGAGAFTVTGQAATLRVIKPTYLAHTFGSTAGTTRTFTNASIGAASSDRLVVAVLMWALAGSTTVSTVTIGGNAADIIGQCNGSNTGICIAYLKVTSGTTATITFNMATSVARSSIAVYTITGQTTDAPYDSHFPAGGGEDARTATLDIAAAGAAIVAANSGTVTGGGFTNAVEDLDYTNGSDDRHYAGHQGANAAQVNYDISHSLCRAIAAASWR